MIRCICGLLVAIAAAAKEPESAASFFDRQVAPILTRRCLGCHNQQLNNGGISFGDPETLLKSGPRGPAIVPGKPGESALIAALRHDSEIQMPPGPKLPAREIKVLTEWIRRGAIWGARLKGLQ